MVLSENVNDLGIIFSLYLPSWFKYYLLKNILTLVEYVRPEQGCKSVRTSNLCFDFSPFRVAFETRCSLK